MNLQFVPFGREHYEAAGAVLADMHRLNRKREPRLAERYEEATVAREVIAKTCTGPGVAALRNGRLAGYLVALLEVDMERVAVVLPSGAAIDPGEDPELYRQMYAAAAERWVRNGYFAHYVHVASSDRDAIRAWFSLGFGRYSIYNWRDLSRAPGLEAEVEVRRVGADAFDDEEKLRSGLRRYNATSPILHPLVHPSRGQIDAIFEAERQQMADDKYAYFIAYRADEPAGLMILEPPRPDYVLTPDRSVYLHIAFVEDAARSGGVGAALVNRGLAWAREEGYELCTVGYFSPNLLAARFWPSKGFRPLGYCLERRIDERIAWARGEDA